MDYKLTGDELVQVVHNIWTTITFSNLRIECMTGAQKMVLAYDDSIRSISNTYHCIC